MADYSTYGGVRKIAGMISQCINALGGDPERAHRVDIRHGAPSSDKLVTRDIILIAIEVQKRA
jgi:hypothetical protein